MFMAEKSFPILWFEIVVDMWYRVPQVDLNTMLVPI